MHPSMVFASEAFGAKDTTTFTNSTGSGLPSIINPSPFGFHPPLQPVVPAPWSEPVYGASSKSQFGDSTVGSISTLASLVGGVSLSSCIPPVSTSQSIPILPCCNPTSRTKNVPSQAASKPSFYSTTTNPQVTPVSGTKNPFETNLSSSGTQSFEWGFSNHVANDQRRGSHIAPYVPTYENPEFGQCTACKLFSISAMHAYSDKSHEELRLEDYQLNTEKPFAFPFTSGTSTDPNPKCGLFGGLPSTFKDQLTSSKVGFELGSSLFGSNSSNQQPSNPHRMDSSKSNTFGQFPKFGELYQPGLFGATWSSSSFGTTTLPGFSSSQNAGPSSSESREKPGFGGSCTCNKRNTFAEISSGFTAPTGWSAPPPFGSSSGAHANPATPAISQGTNTSFSAQPLGLGAASGSSFASPVMNPTTPCWPLNGGVTPMCVPTFVPYFLPCASSIWAPSSCIIPAIGSNRLPTMELVGVNGLNSAQSTDPTAEVSNRSSPFGRSKPTTNSTDHNGDEKADNDLSVPKGLEMIAEKLGVNPWAKATDRKDISKEPTGGWRILPCEEADKDEDIIALAEFAVEQHNAMNKNSRMNLSRVLGACLEAVHNGRYHIVLETKDATGIDKPLRFYAVVLQRKTDRQTLMLLEKWLPGEPKSIED